MGSSGRVRPGGYKANRPAQVTGKSAAAHEATLARIAALRQEIRDAMGKEPKLVLRAAVMWVAVAHDKGGRMQPLGVPVSIALGAEEAWTRAAEYVRGLIR